MARNEKSRQKHLAKKHRKDNIRRKAHAGTYVSGPAHVKAKIRHARDLPMHECLINPSWREAGLARILVSRQQPEGDILFGVYLVDVWCLGLKSTFCNAGFAPWRYKAEVRGRIFQEERPMECPLAVAQQVIYGAIDYAGQFGFTPDKDFRLSRFVLDQKDAFEPCDDIEFGKEGKPFYVSGPNDNPARVVAALSSVAGEGNFDFVMGGPISISKVPDMDMPVLFL